MLKTFFFRRRRRGARQFQEVELLLTGIVVIVVCWWSFHLISLFFRKGFVFSQQFPVYLGRFSLNVICLVWFFLSSGHANNNEETKFLDCSKTVFWRVVGFQKKIKSRNRRIRRDRDLWGNDDRTRKFARPKILEREERGFG